MFQTVYHFYQRHHQDFHVFSGKSFITIFLSIALESLYVSVTKVVTNASMCLINVYVEATSNGVIVFILSVIQGNIRFAIASCSTTKTLVPSSIVEIQ